MLVAMCTTSLTVIALLAQYTVAQITGTYSSILLTATGTPTFTVPVEQETNFPSCTVSTTCTGQDCLVVLMIRLR